MNPYRLHLQVRTAGFHGDQRWWQTLRAWHRFSGSKGSPQYSGLASGTPCLCRGYYSTTKQHSTKYFGRANKPHQSVFVPDRCKNSVGLLMPGLSRFFSGSSTEDTRMVKKGPYEAYIALGSNLGDRLTMIEQACREMEARGIRIVKTSNLYETEPMYVKDQDTFLNGACKVETFLDPLELLNTLQSIENDLGRYKTVEKGPRLIDLDILLYENEMISNDRLIIPHPLMLEREFVLRPFCQLVKHDMPIPSTQRSYKSQLDSLMTHPRPIPITPLSPSHPPLRPSDPARRTQLMAVLNLTPDSFSDGGIHSPTDLSALTHTILAYIHSGATIIDVGGESTRPHAAPVSESEELARVLPAIRLIRSIPEAAGVIVSIDTYRAAVAEKAVRAGADVINDISAGMLDPDMLPTAARLGCTIILSHSRGTPQTMGSLTDYRSSGGVVRGVAAELSQCVRAAELAGVRRWRIVLDPGIGFAKTQRQNLELLRCGVQALARIGDGRDTDVGERMGTVDASVSGLDQTGHNPDHHLDQLDDIPWLVGPSRKKFVGTITGVGPAAERGYGTAATVTAAVQGGADVVRVHDVEKMRQVVAMADAIYRDWKG